MRQSFINGQMRDVVWSERRDTGGMFEATVGIYKDGDGYRTFVLDLGLGMQSKLHHTYEDARNDVERCLKKFY
jgi:hypothetical protein